MHPTSQRQRSAATASCINTASRCSRASASACLSLAPTHVSVCRSVFSSVLDTSVCLRYSRATDCTAHGASQVCAYHTWRSRCQFLLHASSFCCSLIRAFSCTGCHSSQIKSCPPTLNPDINQNLNNQPCNHNTHTHTHIHTHTHTHTQQTPCRRKAGGSCKSDASCGIVDRTMASASCGASNTPTPAARQWRHLLQARQHPIHRSPPPRRKQCQSARVRWPR